jgi:hypothetical protein
MLSKRGQWLQVLLVLRYLGSPISYLLRSDRLASLCAESSVVCCVVILTSHDADRSAITMATLREQIALKRQQLDNEKRLLADSQAREQKLTAEKTAYLDYEERLRQELADLDSELHDVGSETTTSKANVDQLLQERTAWDPEYLAQLESAKSLPGPVSSDFSKALAKSSASGPVTPAVNRPESGSSIDDTNPPDASSVVPRPATDLSGNFFEDSYHGFDQDYDDFQNDSVNDNEDSGVGLDEELSGEVSTDVPGTSVITTPVFGSRLQARTWDPKYLAASTNGEIFALPMPSGLNFDGNDRIIRDHTRTDQLFDYRLIERRYLYLLGWNPDALDNDIFPPHSDEAHMMKALAAAKDGVLSTIDRHQSMNSGFGVNKDCYPQGLSGLPASGRMSYRCPSPGCEKSRHTWNLCHYRLAALCRLERHEYWKMCLPREPQITTSATAFDASAECCEYQRENHCVTHVHMETSTYNQRDRKPHHSGKQSCHCPISCIGSAVTHSWTEQDYQLLDRLRRTRRTQDAGKECQAEGCKTICRTASKPTDKRPCYCFKHSNPNVKTGECQVDGCKVKFRPTDERPSHCSDHALPCKTTGCNGRTKNTRCEKCIRDKVPLGPRYKALSGGSDASGGSGRECQQSGCSAKLTQIDGQSSHCIDHRPSLPLPQPSTDPVIGSVCHVNGCHIRSRVMVGQHVYCNNHSIVRLCRIEGCQGYSSKNNTLCSDCIGARRKRKQREKGDEDEDLEESAGSPKQPRVV